jgi:hypothetical protein
MQRTSFGTAKLAVGRPVPILFAALLYGFGLTKKSSTCSFLTRSLTCLNLAAAASGLGYAVITTIPNTLITMYHEEPELYYGSHSRAGVGEDIAILDSGYFLSQVPHHSIPTL